MDLGDGESHRFLFLLLSEDGRWHPESSVYPSVVVVVDLLMNGFDELSDMVEPLEIAQFEFEP